MRPDKRREHWKREQQVEKSGEEQSQPLNSPRLKGYSPGFKVGSCDAEADVDVSVVDPVVEERDRFVFGSVASSQHKNKEDSYLMIHFRKEN